MFGCVCAAFAAMAQAYAPEFVRGDVEAVVTYSFPGESFLFALADDGTAWRIDTGDNKKPAGIVEGMRIAAQGEILKDAPIAQMWQAKVENVAMSSLPATLELTPQEMHQLRPGDAAWRRAWYGHVVTTQGEVRDINRRATYTQLLIGPTNALVMVSVPIRREAPLPQTLAVGVEVRVTGVGVYRVRRDVQTGALFPVEDIEVRLRSPKALEILIELPFWTVGRVVAASGGIVAVLVAIIVAMQLKRSRERIAAEATARERLRLSHDLHDDFQQLLAGTMFRIGAAQNNLEEKDIAAANVQLAKAVESLGYTQAQLRTVLWSLNEESEGPASLVGLFKYAAERMAHWKGIVEISSVGKEPRLARSVSGTLLMVLQEAVANALNHGFATKIEVKIAFTPKVLMLVIRDNGVGFDVSRAPSSGHYGLSSMRERIAHIGGEFDLESISGTGTVVSATIQLENRP